MIASGHSKIAKNELWEEREIEANEQNDRCQPPQCFRIHPARHLRPPEMQTGHEGAYHPSNHHVVEMRHDEIGLGEMDIHTECRQHYPGTPSNRKETEKPKGVEHGCFECDRSLVQGRRPVEDFDG